MKILWVHAAAREAESIPALPGGRIVELGVGKTEAAMRLTAALVERRPERVFVFGVAGAYPGRGLDVGDLCVVTREQLADEGVMTPGGFSSLDDLGLGSSGPFNADGELGRRVASALSIPRVAGNTVSTCSGTDAASEALAARTDAAVETMEGAVVGRVCAEFSIGWVQLRAISNRTGDRDRAGWDLELALQRLRAGLVRLLAEPSTLSG